ncbi:hypothetical protein MPTK1_3g03170 [Marchantia polymorpha subsp. ruderalis]|uniref:Uncharacterized protein n=2 Tax=Marchantia polymorpha TaxID=3197 RepID=A0AAF6AWY4_MARPO|nr:hypothetical protein MARPO_0212s0009 [Marchantia polymorpha]BBN04268.1 hypothetical protein Mp_3g03170 [Marchantia polymorpha subsp. ruderalis]|eukprot:PTQ27231.1 hypothetical protein MARPO_0212s0009 [Marchantia polymorpha]
MGSLMAGWKTPSSGQSMKRSHSSLTKNDIEKFWRVKQSTFRRHLRQAQKDAFMARSITIAEDAASESGLTGSDHGESDDEVTATTPSSRKSSTSDTKIDWWTKSRWAFLNEPPIIGKKHDRYTAQFHLEGMNSDPDVDVYSNPGRKMRRRGSLPAMPFKL